MALAIATGITPSDWAAEGARAIVTAAELLEEAQRKTPGHTDDQDDDVPMSG